MEGTILAGKYALTEKLGEGGHGVVWLARHTELDVPVAVKFLGQDAQKHPDVQRRFLREARAAAKLRSPHVVQVFDYGVEDERPFIVMEWLRGETLHARLTKSVRLSPQACATLLGQVAKAVALAHENGIIHRDLKPDNVFLTQGASEGDPEVAKILDFGIVKSTGRELVVSAQTRTGTLLGTPYYMSPEQIAGSENVDHHTDIWALGVIAYECLLGRRPVDGDSLPGVLLQIASGRLPIPSSVGPVPAGFDAWFARACAADPRDRFDSARDAIAELAVLCEAGKPLVDNSSDVLEKTPLPRTRTHPPEATTEQGRSASQPDAPALGSSSIAPAMSTTQRPQPSLLRTRWFVPASISGSVLVAVLLVWIGFSGAPREDAGEREASAHARPLDTRGAGPGSPPPPHTAASAPVIAPILDTSPGIRPLSADAGAPASSAEPSTSETPSKPKAGSRRGTGDSKTRSKKKPAPFEAGF
jgi:serine/threonine-protein kinase